MVLCINLMKPIILVFNGFHRVRSFSFTSSDTMYWKKPLYFLDEVSVTASPMFSLCIVLVTSPHVYLAAILKLYLLTKLWQLRYKKIPKFVTVMFSPIFSDSVMFRSTFRNKNNLLCQTITLWKANEIASKSRNYRRRYNTLLQIKDCFERKATGNTRRKAWQPEKSRKMYQNRQIHGGIGRVGRSNKYISK